MYNDVLQLIKVVETVDSFGDRQITYNAREVFCEVKSVSQTEFYQAQAVGFRPEIKFVLADYYEYDFEPIVEYNDIKYSVIRTYRSASNEIEIVCRRGID